MVICARQNLVEREMALEEREDSEHYHEDELMPRHSTTTIARLIFPQF
jgi:hypothetical protein